MTSRLFHVLCALAALVLLTLPGCDDSGDDGSGSDTMSGSDTTGGTDTTGSTGGTTQCGPDPSFSVTCAAGQYCRDQDLRECDNGCLSNQNCASDQTCVIPSGETVGACQNNTQPTGATRDEVCAKLQACDPQNFTDPVCDQFYAGTNATCHDCVAGANCPELNGGTACQAECGFN